MVSERKRVILILAFIGVVTTELGCLTAGTHGSIKSYDFSVPKPELQIAMSKVIRQGSNIRVAPISDTFTSKYYNDSVRYLTLKIGDSLKFNEYIIQFTGDKESWETARSSEISIAYAYDTNGNGGSIGNGRFQSLNTDIRNAIISLFESEFVDKIDSVLKSGRSSFTMGAEADNRRRFCGFTIFVHENHHSTQE